MVHTFKQSKLEHTRQETAELHYRVEMCGKRVTLAVSHYRQGQRYRPCRGIVTCFSKRARARKLRRLAEINWAETGESQFLTVTYPDECCDHTMQQRKTHRFLLNRWICNEVGRPVGAFWRVEWMPRQTGQFIGQMMPHMHFLYIAMPKICEMKIRLRWMQILGASRYLQVKIKPVERAETTGIYVAKYCAKEASNLLLDNVPKRNRCGRHAGELRKELIPVHDLQIARRLDAGIVKYLKRRAYETLWWFDERHDEGFTILGDEALEIIREIHESGLAYTTIKR